MYISQQMTEWQVKERQARLDFFARSIAQQRETALQLDVEIVQKRAELARLESRMEKANTFLEDFEKLLERTVRVEDTLILDTTFYDAEAQCVVCREDWKDNKRYAIPCGHVCCSKCMTPKCAMCRAPVIAYITLKFAHGGQQVPPHGG